MTGWMRRACSSKSQMNSRPVPFARVAAAVLGEDRDARAEQRAPHHRDERDALHEVEHLRRIGLARARLRAAQQRIAALDDAIGGVVLRAADRGLPSLPGVGKAGLGYWVSSQFTTASMRSMSA